MIPERFSCAIGVSFSSFEIALLLFVSEEFDMLKFKTNANENFSKFYYHNLLVQCKLCFLQAYLPTICLCCEGRRINFCGMLNMLINGSGCVMRDSITKINHT